MTAPALVRLLAALLLGLGAVVPAAAQTVWRMPTEYPATAMPGEGIAVFAVAVANRAGGRLTIEPSYDARLGIRSADLPKAVGDGTVEAGDAFGSALAGLDPIFGLAALPSRTRGGWSIGRGRSTSAPSPRRGCGCSTRRPGRRAASG